MIRRIIFLLLIGLGTVCTAQTREEVLSKVVAQYTVAKPLQYSLTYNLYKSPKERVLHQSYNGSYYKVSSDVYMKIDKTEYFITDKLNVQISHKEKTMLFSNGSADTRQMDINELLKQFKKGDFADKKTHWELELISHPFSGLPYSKIVLFIGKDFFIQKQHFYYSASVDFSNDYKKQDLHYPLLEVIFGKPNRKAIDKSIFNASKYYSIEKKKIKLSSAYTNYQIIDKRK